MIRALTLDVAPPPFVLDENGRKIVIRHKAEDVLAGVLARYGQLDHGNTESMRALALEALVETMSSRELLVRGTTGAFSHAVVGRGYQFVVASNGKPLLCMSGKRLAGHLFPADAFPADADLHPLAFVRGPCLQPVIDARIEAELRRLMTEHEKESHFSLDDFAWFRPSDVLDDAMHAFRRAVRNDAIRDGGDDRKWSKAAMVLQNIMRRTATLNMRANGLTRSLVQNKEALRLCRPSRKDSFDKSECDFRYTWLLHEDAAIARNRRQFATVYPEWVDGAVQSARGHDYSPVSAALHSLVDTGQPVDLLFRTELGLPSWLLRGVRGLLDKRRLSKFIKRDRILQSGKLDGLPELDRSAVDVLTVVGELGPSWLPSRSDIPYAGAICGFLREHGLPPSMLRAGIPAGQGSDPWRFLRNAFRRTNPGMGVGIQLSTLSDFIYAWSCLLRACCGVVAFMEVIDEWGGPALYRSLGQPNFIDLVRMNAAWHSPRRQELMAVARQVGDVGLRSDPEERQHWPALFEPRVIGGLSMRCLTTQAELDENGRAMKHCVGNYGWQCRGGRTHIVAVERDGHCVATGEFAVVGSPDDDLSIAMPQLRGPRNANPPAVVRRTAGTLLGSLRENLDRSHLTSILERGKRVGSHGRGKYRQFSVDEPERLAAFLDAWRPAMPTRMRRVFEEAGANVDGIQPVITWLLATELVSTGQEDRSAA